MKKFAFQPDAAYYTVPEAITLFVPNIVWNEVRLPRNQLLYGGQGTGKTMLLRRLSWPAMLSKPEFIDSAEFAGFYCDMRDLGILRSLFLAPLTQSLLSMPEALKLSVLLSSVHLLDSLTKTILECKAIAASARLDLFQESLIETVNSFAADLGLQRSADLEQMASALAFRKAEIVRAIGSPTSLRAMLPQIDSAPEPEILARVLSLAVERHRTSERLGFLIDQYEYLPAPCRYLFNALLKRENERSFFSIIACRPFAFSPEIAAGFIQPGEDFRFTVVEYFENESYEDLLTDIWDAFRPQGPRIGRLLEGGLKYFATLSARSVRRFMELCQASGALAGTYSDHVSKRIQRRAAENISNQARDQIKVASDVSPGSIWHLLLRISEKASHLNSGKRTLPLAVHFKSDDLISFEYLSQAGKELVYKAFEEGALQFSSRRDASSLSVPDHCIISPVLGPAIKYDLGDQIVNVQVTRDEVEQIAKGGPRIGSPELISKREVSKVFLSISFADLPEPTVTRRLFKDIFGEAGIKIIEGLGLGNASLDQIKSQLENTDLTLLELTHLRSNVIFEMGLTLGLSHRLVPILNRGAQHASNLTPYPFLVDMGHLEYSFESDAIRDLRERVIAWAEGAIDPAHLLDRSIGRGVKLRVKQVPNSLAIYYPEAREGLWKSFHEGLRKIAGASRTSLHLISHRPFQHDLTSLLDHLVWCVSRSESIIVDTTGVDEPDLYGAFALGFAYGSSAGGKGRSKRILRIEEANAQYNKGLSMWPTEYFRRWKNAVELFEVTEQFLPNSRARRGR